MKKEEKEKSNNGRTILLASVAVIALIVIVAGATFAFFETTMNIDTDLPVNTQTASSMYSFSATANENIEFNLSASEMSQANVKESALKSDSANLYMEVASATDNETTTCTYDIQWVWDSADKYTEADVELPYTKDEKSYPYELSITVDGENERDLSDLTWTDGKAIVATGLKIESTSKTPVKLTHLIEVKAYNIPVSQKKLYNKDFKAHLEVVNNSCASKTSGSSEGGADVPTPEPQSEIASTFITNKAGETINLTDGGETYTGEVVDENTIFDKRGIRYEGKNPNNYVLFNDELWRVIGVFDEETHGRSGEELVKLVKAGPLPDSYQWASDYVNNWNNATLKKMLNTDYYNNNTLNSCAISAYRNCEAKTVTNVGLKTDAVRNMIQPIQWKIGAHKTEASSPINYYSYERGDTLAGATGATAVTTETLPIGLIYPSDYGFAVLASDCDRGTTIYKYGTSNPLCHENNWLFLSGYIGMLITSNSTDDKFIYEVNSIGAMLSAHSDGHGYVVPSLYLKQNIKITGGQGTKANPYTLG